MARVIDTSPQHNLSAFARGLAKIAYCNAVMKYGQLDGFRHLATTDMILGRYPNIAYFIILLETRHFLRRLTRAVVSIPICAAIK